MRSDLYAHVLSLSPGSLEKNTSGDVLSRLQGDTIRAETLVYTAPIVALAAAAVYLVFPLYLNWQLTLCTLAAPPVIVWLVNRYSPLVRRASRLSRQGESLWMSLAEERLNAAPVVHVYDAECFKIEYAKSAHLRCCDVGEGPARFWLAVAWQMQASEKS